ncbi:MAG: manganese efflux pump [Salinivirgaceae bacterium]|nr:manganese efflux pump [Salinivirgaceae bacterium]
MWQIISGSLLLSLVHAAIPNHWLPIVAIGKSERWSIRETLNVTMLIGVAHIASTIIVGVLVGLLGVRMSDRYEEYLHWVAPAVIALLGVVFIVADLLHRGDNHNHFDNIDAHKSKSAIVTSMLVAMFLSPCIELDAYFLLAVSYGWQGILVTSVVYIIATVSAMMILVYLGLKGLHKLNWHLFEHRQKTVTGIILILVAAATLFLD